MSINTDQIVQQTDTTTITVISAVLVPIGFLLTYGLSKCVDRFCAVDVDEAVIRRIEEMRLRERTNVTLDRMEPEERLKVLERVLDCKPYSRELAAQLRMDRDRLETFGKDIECNEESVNDTNTNIEDGNTKFNPNLLQEEGKDEEINILGQVWKEFGESKKVKSIFGSNIMVENLDDTKQQNDLTETCAICMEDYHEDEDIIIGNNCFHMYHKDCLMKWMSYRHDTCPYCRSFVFDEQSFRIMAKKILGEERYTAALQLTENVDPEVS